MLPDGADCIVAAAMQAMREAFTPDSTYPPLGGGTDRVRFFAGQAAPISAFDFHVNDPDCGCSKPFVWVRLTQRYRSDIFPTPWLGDAPCDKPHVVVIEIGVARCSALVQPNCDWSAYESEAEISMDDSRRIEIALCRARALMAASRCSDMVAFDTITPVGPEGGVMSWMGILYARVDSNV